MITKLKTIKTELLLLGFTAAFLCGLTVLARRDRAAENALAAAESVVVLSETDLPPEEVEVLLVDVNTAGMDELVTLPGIGEGLARRIVKYREENGPFLAAEDLLEISGIGEKTLAELREYITISGGTT